jgi:hypothetical protein
MLNFLEYDKNLDISRIKKSSTIFLVAKGKSNHRRHTLPLFPAGRKDNISIDLLPPLKSRGKCSLWRLSVWHICRARE